MPKTMYLQGDLVEYTGDTRELYGAVFYVVRRVSDGKELLTRCQPDGINPRDAEKAAEWQAEQEDFRRLRQFKSTESS